MNPKFTYLCLLITWFNCLYPQSKGSTPFANLNDQKINELLANKKTRAFSKMLRCFEPGMKVLGVAGLYQLKQKNEKLDADDEKIIEELAQVKTKLRLLWYSGGIAYSKTMRIKKIIKRIKKGKIGIIPGSPYCSSPDRILD